ncbi:hypothetical protein GSQ51_19330 [Clostridioides difficile]|nr:hypothetical protein [Clostridioides difficile]NJK16227.1 hypothetical protein [Clostridioides difficile]
MNYFLKIYIQKTKNKDAIRNMIYAFCMETDREVSYWRKKTLMKIVEVHYCIIDEKSLELLKESFKSKEMVLNIGKESISIFGGFGRKPSNIFLKNTILRKASERKFPYLTHLETYFVLNKKDLLDNIVKNSKGNSYLDKVENFNKILDLISKDSGFNFRKEDFYRLGNFDIQYIPHKDLIELKREECKKKIKIHKKRNFEAPVLLHCRLFNKEDCIVDKIIKFNTNSIEYTAEEDIDACEINIWNEDSGELIYQDFMHFIKIKCDIEIYKDYGTIETPTTKKLTLSNSKAKDDVKELEKKIEKEKLNLFGSENYSDKDQYSKNYEYSMLMRDNFILNDTKGVFCKKVSSNQGEIDSFKVIKEYINNTNLSEITILDPFFSCKSMEKILTTTTNNNTLIKILFSINSNDPDTKKEDPDAIEKMKELLNKNLKIMHKNLIMLNITTKSDHAFHDRYLIRKWENGTYDGFILSNSINAAGQNYPFAIIPMENKILLSVQEYIKSLENGMYYPGSKIKKLNVDKISETKINNDKVSIKSFEEKKAIKIYEKEIEIHEKEIEIHEKEKILDALFKCYWYKYENKKNLIKILGYLSIYSNSISIKDLKNYIISKEINKIEIIDIIKDISIECDLPYNYETEGKKLRKNMLEKKEDFKNTIFKYDYYFNTESEYNLEMTFLEILYDLVLEFNPPRIEEIISESKSPIALIQMILYSKYHFNNNLYLDLMKSDNIVLSTFAYYWIKEKIIYTKEKINDYLKLIDELEIDKRIYTISYIISGIDKEIRKYNNHLIYYEESDLNDIKVKKENLLENLIKLLNGKNNTIDKDLLMNILCKNSADYENIICISRKLNDNNNLRTYFLEKVISNFESLLHSEESIDYLLLKDTGIEYYAALASELLYKKCDVEDICRKFEEFKYFSTSIEPHLYYIDYDVWNDATVKSLSMILYGIYYIRNIEYKKEKSVKIKMMLENKLNEQKEKNLEVYDIYEEHILKLEKNLE